MTTEAESTTNSVPLTLESTNKSNTDQSIEDENFDINISTAQENFDTTNSDGLPLSPTSLRRRSTRVSALNAQKRIKGEEIMVDSQVETLSPTDNEVQTTSKEIPVPVKKLKRKIESGEDFDQFDCKFGIRLDEDGEVVSMSGSEISSLNAESVAFIRKKYAQRHIQLHELEEALRLEEAKLCMLKKIRQNQQENHPNENNKAISSNITQNTDGNAYKPAVATPIDKVNGNSKKSTNKSSANPNPLAAWSTLTPQNQQIFQTLLAKSGQPQLAQLLRNLPPGNFAALLQQHAQAQQQQQKASNGSTGNNKTPSAAAVMAHEAAAKAREAAQSNAQKLAAARMHMRRQLEQQLTQIPAPKAPTPDLSFIPNGTHPDFLCMLGLDLTVQRVLKDKNVFKKMDFEPYVCEECSTDFTPSWKAISGLKGDYHLYCEQCVRQTQKRQIRQDHTLLLKKQLAAGKFTEPISMPSISSISSNTNGGNSVNLNSGTPKATINNSSNRSNHTSSANVSINGTNGFAQTQASSANTGSANRNTSQQHISSSASNSTSNTPHNNARTAQATTSSSTVAKSKRSNQNTSNTNMNAATIAALQNNSLITQQLSFLRNPIMAAMMSNPNPMIQQILAQQMLNRGMNNVNNNNSQAMAALIAAAQQSTQQQQQHTNSAASTQSSTVGQNNNMQNSFSQLMATMNNSPLFRQVQQQALAQQMRDMAKSKK